MRQAIVLLACSGCAQILGITDPTPGTGPGSDGGNGTTEHVDVPTSANRDLDLLFMIDDSPSMLDKQDNLRANFPNLINALELETGGLPNLHLGVITSDLGTREASNGQDGAPIGSGPSSCANNGKGGLLQVGMAGAMITGNFISDVDGGGGTRITNYTGNLSDVFSAMAQVGAVGCGFEQHLEAIKVALSAGANAGFLRPSALLAVVILADEDDCSLQDFSVIEGPITMFGEITSFRCTRFGVTCDVGGASPDDMNTIGAKDMCHSNTSKQFLTDAHDYVAFFKGLKTDPQSVFVAAIAGDPTPVATELRQPAGGGTAIPQLAHSCTFTDQTGPEVADPAVRIKQVVDGFPGRGVFGTVCQQDLSGVLTQIGQQIRQAAGGVACFTNDLADGDTVTPGLQPKCVVQDVSASKGSMTLSACIDNGNVAPCWDIMPDATQCAAGSHLELTVQRTQNPPADDHVVADCQIK